MYVLYIEATAPCRLTVSLSVIGSISTRGNSNNIQNYFNFLDVQIPLSKNIIRFQNVSWMRNKNLKMLKNIVISYV